jgi:hypothetical protein
MLALPDFKALFAKLNSQGMIHRDAKSFVLVQIISRDNKPSKNRLIVAHPEAGVYGLIKTFLNTSYNQVPVRSGLHTSAVNGKSEIDGYIPFANKSIWCKFFS